MSPVEITSLVLQMTPPKGIWQKSDIEVWRIRKAAEIGIKTAYRSVLEKAILKDKTWE